MWFSPSVTTSAISLVFVFFSAILAWLPLLKAAEVPSPAPIDLLVMTTDSHKGQQTVVNFVKPLKLNISKVLLPLLTSPTPAPSQIAQTVTLERCPAVILPWSSVAVHPDAVQGIQEATAIVQAMEERVRCAECGRQEGEDEGSYQDGDVEMVNRQSRGDNGRVGLRSQDVGKRGKHGKKYHSLIEESMDVSDGALTLRRDGDTAITIGAGKTCHCSEYRKSEPTRLYPAIPVALGSAIFWLPPDILQHTEIISKLGKSSILLTGYVTHRAWADDEQMPVTPPMVPLFRDMIPRDEDNVVGAASAPAAKQRFTLLSIFGLRQENSSDIASKKDKDEEKASQSNDSEGRETRLEQNKHWWESIFGIRKNSSRKNSEKSLPSSPGTITTSAVNIDDINIDDMSGSATLPPSDDPQGQDIEVPDFEAQDMDAKDINSGAGDTLLAAGHIACDTAAAPKASAKSPISPEAVSWKTLPNRGADADGGANSSSGVNASGDAGFESKPVIGVKNTSDNYAAEVRNQVNTAVAPGNDSQDNTPGATTTTPVSMATAATAPEQTPNAAVSPVANTPPTAVVGTAHERGRIARAAERSPDISALQSPQGTVTPSRAAGTGRPGGHRAVSAFHLDTVKKMASQSLFFHPPTTSTLAAAKLQSEGGAARQAPGAFVAGMPQRTLTLASHALQSAPLASHHSSSSSYSDAHSSPRLSPRGQSNAAMVATVETMPSVMQSAPGEVPSLHGKREKSLKTRPSASRMMFSAVKKSGKADIIQQDNTQTATTDNSAHATIPMPSRFTNENPSNRAFPSNMSNSVAARASMTAASNLSQMPSGTRGNELAMGSAPHQAPVQPLMKHGYASQGYSMHQEQHQHQQQQQQAMLRPQHVWQQFSNNFPPQTLPLASHSQRAMQQAMSFGHGHVDTVAAQSRQITPPNVSSSMHPSQSSNGVHSSYVPENNMGISHLNSHQLPTFDSMNGNMMQNRNVDRDMGQYINATHWDPRKMSSNIPQNSDAGDFPVNNPFMRTTPPQYNGSTPYPGHNSPPHPHQQHPHQQQQQQQQQSAAVKK